MNKSKLRARFLALRREILAKNKIDIEAKIIANLSPLISSINGKSLALYYPKSDEISLLKLTEEFSELNFLIPSILPDSKILRFFKYSEDNLKFNFKYKIYEPDITEKDQDILPDILIVPLIAYDNRLHRIGYGGGYYDATIQYLKAQKHNFISVGIGHSVLKTNELIEISALDQSLDYIVNEK